jgi:hypothetical protein
MVIGMRYKALGCSVGYKRLRAFEDETPDGSGELLIGLA